MEDKLLAHNMLLAGMSFGNTIAAILTFGLFLWIVRPWGSLNSKGVPDGSVERAFLVIVVFWVLAILVHIFYK